MIKQFFRFIFNKVEDYLLTQRLKKDIIYTTKDKNIMFYLDEQDKLIRVFVHGVIYKIPIHQTNNVDSYTSMFNDPSLNFLQNESIENLNLMLKDYEEIEDYENCSKIQEIINSKLQNNDNN